MDYLEYMSENSQSLPFVISVNFDSQAAHSCIFGPDTDIRRSLNKPNIGIQNPTLTVSALTTI